MAKIIFKEIGSDEEIKQAAELIGKHLRYSYHPEEKEQPAYGDITDDDIDLLITHGYNVNLVEAD